MLRRYVYEKGTDYMKIYIAAAYPRRREMLHFATWRKHSKKKKGKK